MVANESETCVLQHTMTFARKWYAASSLICSVILLLSSRLKPRQSIPGIVPVKVYKKPPANVSTTNGLIQTPADAQTHPTDSPNSHGEHIIPIPLLSPRRIQLTLPFHRAYTQVPVSYHANCKSHKLQPAVEPSAP